MSSRVDKLQAACRWAAGVFGGDDPDPEVTNTGLTWTAPGGPVAVSVCSGGKRIAIQHDKDEYEDGTRALSFADLQRLSEALGTKDINMRTEQEVTGPYSETTPDIDIVSSLIISAGIE